MVMYNVQYIKYINYHEGQFLASLYPTGLPTLPMMVTESTLSKRPVLRFTVALLFFLKIYFHPYLLNSRFVFNN